MVPSAGPPGANVSLVGDSVWQLRSDCSSAGWRDNDCVGAALFGDYLCRQEPDDAGTAFLNLPRYGYNQFVVNCTMPAPAPDSSQVRRHARAMLGWGR